jgi:hypothetical protein
MVFRFTYYRLNQYGDIKLCGGLLASALSTVVWLNKPIKLIEERKIIYESSRRLIDLRWMAKEVAEKQQASSNMNLSNFIKTGVEL